MSIALVGLSFRTAPVALRERLAIPHTAIGAALSRHAGTFTAAVPEDAPSLGSAEIGVLSTCNRFEVYVADSLPTPEQAIAHAHRFITAECAVLPDDLAPHLYALTGDAVAAHLFTVAAGLDSMVVGEVQILGQVGDALQLALTSGAAGRTLSSLFRHAIVAGRRVRNETAISQGAASISHAAVLLARERLGDLRDRHILLIGAGKMAELAAHALADHAVGAVRVLNRDPDRAAAIAHTLGGTSCGWHDLDAALAWADVALTSTGAPHTLIHAQQVAGIMSRRADRPLLLIDVAVPRDVDRNVTDVPGVTLVDIDDLQVVIAGGLRDRAALIPAAQALIDDEIALFTRWMSSLEVAPTITDLRAQAEAIRTAEVRKALRRLGALAPQEQQAIEALSVAIVNKLLHAPTVELKRHAGDPRFAQTARTLFGLQVGSQPANAKADPLADTLDAVLPTIDARHAQ